MGAGDTATVGSQGTQLQICRGRHRLGQQCRVLAAHERRGHPDPKLPVPTRNIVDEVCESLRHSRFGVLGEKCVHPVTGFADVERVPDRLLADAVHHRRAGRFDGGNCGQFLGEIALIGPGTTTVSRLATKWSIGLGSARVIASIATAGSTASSSSVRPGVLIAPRPTRPSAWLSVSRSARSGCSRLAQRGRRQISAADAAAASTPAPAGAPRASPATGRDPAERPSSTANP